MSLVTRAKNMIVSPRSEWQVVAAEPTSTAAIYTGYIIPLAAIGPIAKLIGVLITLGGGAFGAAIVGAIVQYLLSIVIFVPIAAFLSALVAGWCGGTNEFGRGLKLVAYGSTASYLGGIFYIYPILGILFLVAAIYGIYLFYTGITPVMNVPSGRAIGYIIVLIIVWVVIFIIVGAISALIIGGSMMGAGMMSQ
jgi:Yip1 domain